LTRPLRRGCSRRTAGSRGCGLLAAGLEFQVFEATAPDGSKVVLRTPVGERFVSKVLAESCRLPGDVIVKIILPTFGKAFAATRRRKREKTRNTIR